MAKLTKARRAVLAKLVGLGGSASCYDLAHPRSHMMHALFMDGLVRTEGRANSWGEPAHDGKWAITPAGRAALSQKEQG